MQVNIIVLCCISTILTYATVFSENILANADRHDVVFLVVGDPLGSAIILVASHS